MPEVGDIGRFSKVGDYSSYCHCLKSERISNAKRKAKTKKMETNISPGFMLSLQILLYDIALMHKFFTREKKQNEMESWRSKHCVIKLQEHHIM